MSSRLTVMAELLRVAELTFRTEVHHDIAVDFNVCIGVVVTERCLVIAVEVIESALVVVVAIDAEVTSASAAGSDGGGGNSVTAGTLVVRDFQVDGVGASAGVAVAGVGQSAAGAVAECPEVGGDRAIRVRAACAAQADRLSRSPGKRSALDFGRRRLISAASAGLRIGCQHRHSLNAE